jgi:hypothetical protein
LFLAAVSGCSNTAGVSGKVTYKGQPVPAGTVIFNAPEGGIFTFHLLADGTYSGTELPPGEYVVTVDTEYLNPQAHKQVAYGKDSAAGNPADEYMKKMKEAGKIPEDAGSNKETYVKIPAKYADKKSSPLKETLTTGRNQKDFELTD